MKHLRLHSGPSLAALLALTLAACAPAPTRQSGGGTEREQDKAAEINVQLAVGYLEEGRLELALDKINKALEFAPRSAQAHSMAGLINEKIGRFDAASEHYARSVKLNPNNGNLLNNYGQFLCKSGELEAAIDKFDRAVEHPFYDTPHVALANACFCYFRSQQFEAAEPYCRRAIDLKQNLPDPYYILARMYLERDDPLRARAFLQRYQSISSDSPQTLELCIRIEESMGDERAAEECRTVLIRRFPDSPEARNLEGR